MGTNRSRRGGLAAFLSGALLHQTGWGQVLGQFLTSDATVDNTLSDGGRSSRSFYNEAGRWDQVKARLTGAQTAGIPTFVFITCGHNDESKLTDTNGADYLTFAGSNPNGTVAGTYTTTSSVTSSRRARSAESRCSSPPSCART